MSKRYDKKQAGDTVWGPEEQNYPGGPIFRRGSSTGATLPEQPSRVTNNQTRFRLTTVTWDEEGFVSGVLYDDERKEHVAIGTLSSTAGWHQAAMTAGTILGLPGGLGAAEFTQAVQEHDARTRGAIQLLHAIVASKKDAWLLPEHQDRLEAICAAIPLSAIAGGKS